MVVQERPTAVIFGTGSCVSPFLHHGATEDTEKTPKTSVVSVSP
jgi:hypothetical protein